MKKRIFIFIVASIVLIVAYNYVYHDHRNIQKENAEFVVTANIIFNEFSNNYEEASTKYLNKTVEISGVITESSENNVTLDAKIFCQFVSKIGSEIQIGDTIKIKGRCIGFDDLLGELKLDQCSIIE